MSTRLEWATAILKGIGIDVYLDGQVAMGAMIVGEGSRAANNPEDTIQPEPGATPYNTFDTTLHVWNYPSMEEGIQAIVATWNNGDNTAPLEALRAKASAEHVLAEVARSSSWDSAGSLYLKVLPEVQADFANVMAVEVAPVTGSAPPAPEPVAEPVAPAEEQPSESADAAESPAGPDQPPLDEAEKVESAVEAQAKVVNAEAVAGKAAALRATISELETHLSELEDLVK
jgi:hypothetical protein